MKKSPTRRAELEEEALFFWNALTLGILVDP